MNEPATLDHAAVLSGDLVKSSDLGREGTDAAIAGLRETAMALGASFGFDPRFTRVRGDGWQMLVPRPGLWLRAAVAQVAVLRGMATRPRCRIAIGLGPAHVPAASDLSAGSGPAFELSGRALDGMRHGAGLTLSAAPGALPATEGAALDALARMAGALAGTWAEAQASTIAALLTHPAMTQDDFAQQSGVTGQAISDRLKRADFDELLTALARIEGAAAEQGLPLNPH